MLKLLRFLIVFLMVAASARGAGGGFKIGEKGFKFCTKSGPKWITFGPKVGSEGAAVLGVTFWRFGVPFGIRFGSVLAHFRGPFSGCFSGGVWGGSWGARHHSGEDEGRMRGGSGEDWGRVGIRILVWDGSWGPLKDQRSLIINT